MQQKFRVYCSHPISGLSWDEVAMYYNGIKATLENIGFEVLQPMTGKSELHKSVAGAEKFEKRGNYDGVASPHSIFARDKWMVQHSDITYVDLTGAKAVSIGCMMELAWAALLGKYVVVVMEDKNLHDHAFVREAASVIFTEEYSALKYMQKLFDQEI